MSRLPRNLEYLKTGFTAEAVAAARFRAYAARAEKEGLPNLARNWLALAVEKDALSISQLEATGNVKGPAVDLGAAIAEESYENDVLYAKMIREADGSTAAVFESVVKAQKDHLSKLERLRDAYNASQGDVPAA